MQKLFRAFENNWLKKPFASDVCSVNEALLPLYMTQLCAQNPERPVVFVMPSEGHWQRSVPIFNAALKQLGMEARADDTALFPDIFDRRNLVPENEIQRIRLAYETQRQVHALNFITPQSLLLPALPRKHESDTRFGFEVRRGMKMDITALKKQLVELDYDDEIEVNMQCEFAHRGGIIDIFSPAHSEPCRLEFFGNQIDSMRLFSVENQRSGAKIDHYRIVPRVPPEEKDGVSLYDLFSACNVLWVYVYPAALCEKLQRTHPGELTEVFDALLKTQNESIYCVYESYEPDVAPVREEIFWDNDLALGTAASTSARGIEVVREMILDRIKSFVDKGYTLAVTLAQAHQLETFRSYLSAAGIDVRKMRAYESPLVQGVLFHSIKTMVLTGRELFYTPHKKHDLPSLYKEKVMQPPAEVEAFGHYADLEEGDYAVHLVHGIGRFLGIRESELNGETAECFAIEYENEAVLYVPIWEASLISRYAGGTKRVPKLSSLNGRRWQNMKEQAVNSMRLLATELLRTQAARRTVTHEPYAPDDAQMQQFESEFIYNETRDQLLAIEEVKTDMQSEHPMDRLLCGDVGYGKTEVALRAIFKAVSAGKQVAFLVPTTILAQQHYFSLLERFAPYPYTIDVLSRFRSESDKAMTLARLETGALDIVVGTHRLIQEDVHFKNLGLIVIDEEQRFGVEHKERLKKMRLNADVLTLSATPIPRTLYMSLTGLRDLSTLNVAPENRLPVKNMICALRPDIIAEGIRREIERGGQVFFLHNRVKTIEKMRDYLQKLVPEATFEIAHGQMDENELEEIMERFIENKFNVLVCTTIIESGVDIPNCNTIFVDNAHRFGLSELYQLRGRVGRYIHQAYAYFLLPGMDILTTNAKKRMEAIMKYSRLGSGFRLAMRDLEIRGGGQLLGAEQSGHISNLGFDLYCRILRETVSQLKNEPQLVFPDAQMLLSFVRYAHKTPPGIAAAAIDPAYMPAVKHRIEFYRRLANCTSSRTIENLGDEMRERFGPLPMCCKTLLQLTQIRLYASRCGFKSVGEWGGRLALTIRPGVLFSSRTEGMPKILGNAPHAKLNCVLDFLHQLYLKQQKAVLKG